jgi:hypothetical protein
MLQEWEVKSLLDHTVAPWALDHTATMTLYTIIAFIISFIAVLMLIWCEKQLWNFGILQHVHLFNIFVYYIYVIC